MLVSLLVDMFFIINMKKKDKCIIWLHFPFRERDRKNSINLKLYFKKQMIILKERSTLEYIYFLSERFSL